MNDSAFGSITFTQTRRHKKTHESTEFSIWEYSAIIFAVVLIAKLVSKKTGSVDVLWQIRDVTSNRKTKLYDGVHQRPRSCPIAESC